jgi:hypothetical protein
LERKIKPASVNQALVELGFQMRPENGKRIWQLTEAGKEYGMSLLATSRTNDWAGPQVTWQESVLPKLLDYFESIESVGYSCRHKDKPSTFCYKAKDRDIPGCMATGVNTQ